MTPRPVAFAVIGTGQRTRVREPSLAGWARSWVVWWALLMALWIAVDYSIALDELLAGAGAAALAAALAVFACHQGNAGLRIRARWLAAALALPGQVVRDTWIVFAALGRCLLRGEQPASGFRELPTRYGDDSVEGVTRRVLLVGGHSLAPNTFVLGIDGERDVIVVHQLMVNQGRGAG